MAETLFAEVTNTSQIQAINVSASHSGTNATATVEALETTLDIGDEIVIDLGYVSEHNIVFTGNVKNIELSASPKVYTITASDIMIRAQEYFIVSTNPDQPLTKSNIAPETLIGELLALAGITDYSGDTSYYVWGVNGSIKINLVSVYDYCKFLADLIAWSIWADETGSVYFADRRPYPMDSDVSIGTLTFDNSTALKPWTSDKNLRNKIVIYGRSGIYSESSSELSYDPITDTNRQIVPVGFYKTTMVSSTLIDSQVMADDACDFNLLAYNRLTCGMSVTIFGDSTYKARCTTLVNAPTMGINNIEYYIYTCEHNWNRNGFVTNLELRL